MKLQRVNSLLALASLAFLAVFAMLATPAPAQAQTINCSTYGVAGTYPADGHAKVCGPGTTRPPQARQDAVFGPLVTMLQTQLLVRGRLAGVDQPGTFPDGVAYYFFRTRAEANSYFANTAPFAGNSGYQSGPNESRCGNTMFASPTKVLVVATWDECTIGTGTGVQWTNPALARAVFHETGHAFAATFQTGGQVAPDRTSGFSSLYQGKDLTLLTPSNWSSYTNVQKETYLCAMFGSNPTSILEIDFGTPSGDAVCTNGHLNNNYKDASGVPFTPATIAISSGNNKLPPYFASSYIEAWAEEFVVYVDGKVSQPAFLPVTDMIYGFDPPTVNGVDPPRLFNCTRYVVETYVQTGARPSNLDLNLHGCPAKSQL